MDLRPDPDQGIPTPPPPHRLQGLHTPQVVHLARQEAVEATPIPAGTMLDLLDPAVDPEPTMFTTTLTMMTRL